jgi:hypothetical protein
MNDILIFCSCVEHYVVVLKEALALFCEATGMSIILEKFAIYLVDDQGPHRLLLNSLLNFSIHAMGDSFKYLGFNLKPNSYGSDDWMMGRMIGFNLKPNI